jgi:CHAD domain-containing protein
MDRPSATFRDAGRAAGSIRGVLELEGVHFAPPVRLHRTLLDTFDGRLHRAGLRLEHRVAGRDRRLVLSGRDVVTVELAVPTAPRFAADLPSGPVRQRLAKIVDVRALLPLVSVDAESVRGERRDRAGKATAVVELSISPTAGAGDLPDWTVEIVALAGYPKPAEVLCDLVAGLGLHRVDGDLLDLACAANGVDPAGTDVPVGIPLDPDTLALAGYREVLGNLADAIDVNWQGSIDDVDPEFLHDLRVAVRRTRSVIAQGRTVLPADVAERFGAGFAWLGQVTGPARDLDVYQIEWHDYVAPLPPDERPSLEPVRAHLEQARRDAYQRLAIDLGSDHAVALMRAWRSWLASSLVGEPEPDGLRPLGDVVHERIARAQKRLLRHGRAITADSPAEQLHDLRKDAKKLRYLFECFGGVLDPMARKASVTRLKALQENLGEHQDAEVHVAMLRDLARHLDAAGVDTDTLMATGRLVELLDRRRLAARQEFAERFAAYDTKDARLP